jgi:hypothetical protein
MVQQQSSRLVGVVVLLKNHYHLLVETSGANLALYRPPKRCPRRPWRLLNQYLGTVLDYLHLNPVRAGIVGGRSNKCLLDYRWSRNWRAQPEHHRADGPGPINAAIAVNAQLGR